MLHMVVEQTFRYPMRIIYHAESGTFTESDRRSLFHERHFTRPYGWIRESGTPPSPHWDCMLMTDREYDLGDVIAVRIIGLFRRRDGDHKYIAVEAEREIGDYAELTAEEKAELSRLYPRVGEGEGWFGREEAEFCMEHDAKAL